MFETLPSKNNFRFRIYWEQNCILLDWLQNKHRKDCLLVNGEKKHCDLTMSHLRQYFLISYSYFSTQLDFLCKRWSYILLKFCK